MVANSSDGGISDCAAGIVARHHVFVGFARRDKGIVARNCGFAGITRRDDGIAAS